MASDDDDAPSSSTNPAITYTRRRKTKTAASSTRRRHNLSLTQSSYGGNSTDDAGNNAKSKWFSRKASGWTDDEIRSHLVTGGASNGGGALSMEGDLIQGSIINDNGDKKRRKKEKRSRRLGPRFAWEEQEEGDGDDQDDEERNNYYGPSKSDIFQKSNTQFTMRAAPTLHDIMDEQDEVDLLAPQQVGNEFQSQRGGSDHDVVVNNNQSPAITSPNNDRRNNAALAEIAQLYNNDVGSVAFAPTATTDSIGWRLLRVLGYRSRLGMAFVSLPGYATGKGDNNDYANDLESMQQQGMATMNLSSKLLASKGLRAIHLPSITTAQNKSPNNADSSCGNKEVLIIPPPKINKHGIGYDPFKNAPEFRAFHEQRQALAQKRGCAADKNESRSTAYFTDNLQRDERQSLWDKNRDNDNNGDDNDGNESSHREREGTNQHMNYAARDYSDFIGTKASSGFALEDEDDTNVYQDDGGDVSGSNMGKYNLEIHSPVASDDEIDDNHNGLFDPSVASSSIKRKSRDGERSVANAWDAWGMDGGTSSASAVTSDGKSALPGFQLESRLSNNGNKQTKRWAGPMLPSGYVLKRHVFQSEQGFRTAAAAYSVNNTDIGLGLDLQSRRQQRPSRSSVPKILPHSDQAQQSQMRTRNGSELNFNAVKESMKNRFVSCSGDTASLKSDVVVRGENERYAKDKEEWITVTGSSWVPSRLLCKRWGVPFPSTSGAVVVTQAAASTKERVYTGEEAYFNETVLSKQNQNNINERSGGHSMGVESKNREDVIFTAEMVEEDIAAPPPTRPSDDLFRSIFDDAGSDMEISSSDEDDDDEEEKQKANEVLGESKAGESETKITTPLDVVAGSRASPFAESDDSHEQTRKHRRDDKRKHRRRSPSTSPDYRDGYDRHYDDHDKRRKKKKKKRHKRSSRQKRH